jgi:SAM-dependent methyltransferase
MNNDPKPKIRTSKTYDKMAGYYDLMMKIFFPASETGRKKIVEKMISGSVLDVACGTGTLLAMAEKKGIVVLWNRPFERDAGSGGEKGAGRRIKSGQFLFHSLR